MSPIYTALLAIEQAEQIHRNALRELRRLKDSLAETAIPDDDGDVVSVADARSLSQSQEPRRIRKKP